MRLRFAHLIDALQFGPQRQCDVLADIDALTREGVPLTQAVVTIGAIYSGIVKKVAQDMEHALSQGHSLASGMESWYPLTITEIIRAGEEGGSFSEALQSAVRYYRERVSAMKLVVQSLLYPLIVVLAALVMLVAIKNSVLMSFASIKPVAQWPAIGQQLYGLAHFIQLWWWFVIFLMIALIAGIYYLLQNVTGPMRYRLDQIPLLSLYRELTAARFMETLGLLMKNGVALKEALHIVARHAEPYLAWHLLSMEFQLSRGQENIADVLNTELIHRHDMLRLRVMAKVKAFDQVLVHLGQQALERYAVSVSRTVKIGAALLLVLGAALAAMIVLGIYSVGAAVAA